MTQEVIEQLKPILEECAKNVGLDWYVYLVLGLISLVTGVIGAYFGAYLKKKGENFAIQEDINKIVGQVEKTTEAAKRIEADISRSSAIELKRWELKKEVYFELSSTVNNLEYLLVCAKGKIDEFIKSQGIIDENSLKDFAVTLLSEFEPIMGEASSLDAYELRARIVCSKDIYDTFRQTFNEMQQLVSSLGENIGDEDAGDKTINKVALHRSEVEYQVLKDMKATFDRLISCFDALKYMIVKDSRKDLFGIEEGIS